MKVEQKIVLVYMVLGIALAFATNYLQAIFGLMIAITISFASYFFSLLVLVSVLKKKKTMLFYNSFITFLLVWLAAWILLYNLGG